jgi:hypothetical protein
MEPRPPFHLSLPSTWPEGQLERTLREDKETLDSLLDAGVDAAKILLAQDILRDRKNPGLAQMILDSPLPTEELRAWYADALEALDQETSASAPTADDQSRRFLRMVKDIVERWRADDKTAGTFPYIKDILQRMPDPFAGLSERHFRRLATEALHDIGSPHTSLKTWIRDLPPTI